MSRRQLSKRSQRRLRLQVARRLAGSSEVPKKPRMEQSTATTDPRKSDGGREAEANQSSSVENGERLAGVEDVEDTERGCNLEATTPSSSEDSGSLAVGSSIEDEPSDSFTEQDIYISDGNQLSEDLSSGGVDSFSDESMRPIHEPSSSANIGKDDDIPLFHEPGIKNNDFNTAFMSLVQRHNLTYSSQSDILKLLSIVLPSPNNVLSSAHVLTNKFVSYKEDTVIHHFCGNCTSPLQPGTSCERQQCIGAQGPHGIFVRIPLSLQLRERFEGTFMHAVYMYILMLITYVL